MFKVLISSFLILSVMSFCTDGFLFSQSQRSPKLKSHDIRKPNHLLKPLFSQVRSAAKTFVRDMSIGLDDTAAEIGNDKFTPFLLRGVPISTKQNKKISTTRTGPLKLGAFKWESCGPANQSVNLRNLSLTPSPLYLPGQLTVSFDVEFRDDIPTTEKLNAKLKLELQTGASWLEIPCIGNVGSCVYTDLCSLSQQIPACPPEFVANNIPCKCPFNKGNYKLPELTVEIDASVFLPGTYRAEAVLSSTPGGQLACYKMSVTIG